MSFPLTADPAAWAAYNAKLLGMPPEELDAEIASIEERAATHGVLATTCAVLTPTAELVARVLKIADHLDSGLATPGACASLLRSAVGLVEE